MRETAAGHPRHRMWAKETLRLPESGCGEEAEQFKVADNLPAFRMFEISACRPAGLQTDDTDSLRGTDADDQHSGSDVTLLPPP